jgi:hypothetical protein
VVAGDRVPLCDHNRNGGVRGTAPAGRATGLWVRCFVRRRACAADRGPKPLAIRFAADSPVEGGVSCELVSEMPNSLLAVKIQGISPIRGLAAPGRQRKRARNQFLAGQFPTHPNREFFAALQGIKSGDQGSFRRDQGIRFRPLFWHSPLVTNPIVATDLERCREGEKERCEMLEAIRSRSRARGRRCPCERRPRHATNRSASSSTRPDRRSGLS